MPAQRADTLAAAFRRVSPERIFEQTGLQPGKLKALYGLLEMRLAGSPQLDAAHTLLMLPDLIPDRADERHAQAAKMLLDVERRVER